MHLPVNRAEFLPKRFPIGTTYVVEGFGGEGGALRVISRYVILPNGQRVNVPADYNQPASPRVFARRQRPRLKHSRPKMPSGSGQKKIAGGRGTG